MIFEGKRIRVSVFGQSHAPAIGAVIDGLPAGFRVDREKLETFLARRAPGQGSLTTARKEPDRPEFLSGLVENVTCGAPVCAVIRNQDAHSADYSLFRNQPRPSHADWPAMVKYGDAFDIRGGGAFSGRMTAPLCIAGGIALQMLEEKGVAIGAHIQRIGAAKPDEAFDPVSVGEKDLKRVRENGFPVLDPDAEQRFRKAIEAAREAGDSVGGLVECAAVGMPVGIGGPLFEGLESALAGALFAIPAVRGVEFGNGFDAATARGSENNDCYMVQDGQIRPKTNRAGGIVGGMTTGMPIVLRVAFKPTPSIARSQRTADLKEGKETELKIPGRHDPCVVVRAVPVVEAVTALVLLDGLAQ